MNNSPNKNAPIGVFDSGLGGLTAVRELKKILPQEDIVYFGDTGRVPYGTRGTGTIVGYARQDIAFLLSRGVKAILAACGTVSTVYRPEEAGALPVSFMGVVEATARAAAARTKNGKIGIIGTEATVSSRSYEKALAKIAPGLGCVANACPLFVPLVENGHYAKSDAMARLAAKEYLAPIKAAGADTLILGCTHYPLMADLISSELEGKVSLVDSGREGALALRELLAAQGLLRPGGHSARYDYYVSDDPEKFGRLAQIFLAESTTPCARRIAIESYRLDWVLKGWLVGIE